MSDRAKLQSELAPPQVRMHRLPEAGTARGNAKMRGICEALPEPWPALWTFATVEGGEPTKNAAERAHRPRVLWQKGSFGSHSAEGSRYAECLLTVTTSCRQQGRSALELLVDALQTARLGLTPPSILLVRSR